MSLFAVGDNSAGSHEDGESARKEPCGHTQNGPPLCGTPGLPSERGQVQQSFSRLRLIAPRFTFGSDSHLRLHLAAPTIESVYLEPTPPLKQKRCPMHAGYTKVGQTQTPQLSLHLLQFLDNHSLLEINEPETARRGRQSLTQSQGWEGKHPSSLRTLSAFQAAVVVSSRDLPKTRNVGQRHLEELPRVVPDSHGGWSSHRG